VTEEEVMELLKYSEDSEGTQLADTAIRCVDRITVEWGDAGSLGGPGYLALAVKGPPPGGTPDETYQIIVEPSELGVMLAAMRPEAVESVVSGFLSNATPEVVGRVAGCIVTHLARALAASAK
jgi:hypothetical protein